MNSAFAATSVENCYQCGKCTAGCPAADAMDFMPNQVLRLVQADEIDRVMRSRAIWLCVSCLTCTTRCPQSVDCAFDMDELTEAVAEIPGVRCAINYKYMCSEPGQALIREKIQSEELEALVVASCSPHMHLKTFRAAETHFDYRAGTNREMPPIIGAYGIEDKESFIR